MASVVLPGASAALVGLPTPIGMHILVKPIQRLPRATPISVYEPDVEHNTYLVEVVSLSEKTHHTLTMAHGEIPAVKSKLVMRGPFTEIGQADKGVYAGHVDQVLVAHVESVYSPITPTPVPPPERL